jgi:hypothetical protein
MKLPKFLLFSSALVALFLSTAAFKPSNADVAKNIVFETDNFDEVSRVRDLLSDSDFREVESLAAKGLIKIRISVKNKKEGTEIDIQGGKN